MSNVNEVRRKKIEAEVKAKLSMLDNAPLTKEFLLKGFKSLTCSTARDVDAPQISFEDMNSQGKTAQIFAKDGAERS